MRLTGTTTMAAVIGSPVRHSRSPAIHNAAFEALGLDWAFTAFEVGPGGGPAAVEAMRALGLGGLSVTMPLKAEVAGAVDDLNDDARVLDAVNCVARDGARLVGLNTDGPGFVRALTDGGTDPAGRRCLVVGAGGAARAVVRALARAGAAEVAVANRTIERGVTAAGLAGDAGRVVAAGALGAAVEAADIVVNATPVGMGAEESLVVDPALLSARHVVVDIVVHPVDTPLLRAARDRGAVTVDGLGMLVHQAAEAFRAWTGCEPPLDAMRRAAEG